MMSLLSFFHLHREHEERCACGARLWSQTQPRRAGKCKCAAAGASHTAALRFGESIFVVVTLLALPFAALAQGQKKPAEAASIAQVEVQGAAKPGGNVVAVVHVKLEKDWHVQSNKPSEPNFFPTVLKLAPTAGVKSATVKYPEGKPEKVQGLAKPLSVYDGDFQISALLTLDAKAKLPLTIPATLSYQACQGATCRPPRNLKFDIAVGSEAKQK